MPIHGQITEIFVGHVTRLSRLHRALKRVYGAELTTYKEQSKKSIADTFPMDGAYPITRGIISSTFCSWTSVRENHGDNRGLFFRVGGRTTSTAYSGVRHKVPRWTLA